jgi:N-acetylmuramoyl-L-alanine amidase
MVQSETISEPDIIKPEIAKPEIAKPEIAKPEIAKPEIAKPEIAKPEIAKPEIVKNSPPAVQAPVRVSKSSVPGQSNVGFALMDDEIVQIDIDSSGPKPQTTVKKGVTKPISSGSSTPYSKLAPSNVSTATSKSSKKSKTISDVLGNSARQLIIAIDAGHGGTDPGALGKGGTKEKDITLRIAKELAAVVNNDPGMKAVLIRDNDVFVPLQERYMKARRLQADLFVSIHADAALNIEANGSSVYVLSTKGASSQAARWLADKENAADLVGGVTLDNKDKNLSAVLLDLSQSATMRMSEDAADIVLKSLKDLGKTHKKQIEHANFVVLRSPDVPSMLVETGFITNMQEERNLNNSEYRQKLAFAISQGIRNFFIEQPLPGTYYAKKQSSPGAGISASSGIIP